MRLGVNFRFLYGLLRRPSVLLWFLRRPPFYSELMFTIFRRRSNLNDTRADSTSWCAERELDTIDAIRNVTGWDKREQLEEKFADIFAVSQANAAECPVRMGGAGNLDLIYWLAEYVEARKVIETGVAYGWSSLAVLLSLRHRDGSMLISTDMPYINRNNDQYVGCVVPTELRSRWRILPYADRHALPKALRTFTTIDMCHYDSDKSYEGRMWAYALLWKSLRPGGILISDDIGDNVAFREFSDMVAVAPVIVQGTRKYVGVLAKPGNQ